MYCNAPRRSKWPSSAPSRGGGRGRVPRIRNDGNYAPPPRPSDIQRVPRLESAIANMKLNSETPYYYADKDIDRSCSLFALAREEINKTNSLDCLQHMTERGDNVEGLLFEIATARPLAPPPCTPDSPEPAYQWHHAYVPYHNRSNGARKGMVRSTTAYFHMFGNLGLPKYLELDARAPTKRNEYKLDIGISMLQHLFRD